MPSENPQLRAAIYDRVSKDKRRDARSVEEQETANITHCDKYGWVVQEIFTDNDRSASRFARKSRPDWERLVETLDDGQIDVLVMWEPSRGDRELEMWARLLGKCRRLGVLIHVTSHDRTYDVRRPRDWRTLAEDGVDSAYESEKVSERIRRGTRARASEGRPHGPPLYGYERVYDPHTGHLVGQTINAAQAAVVKEIADMVMRGISLGEIARRLNARGVPSPRGDRWQASPIKRLVLNPSYLGFRTYRAEKIYSPGWFPPILNERDHYVCVAKLTAPERGGARPSMVKHLLSGLADCGVCDGTVKVINRNAAPRYCCRATGKDGRISGHVVRSLPAVDEYVESVVVALLQTPDAIASMSSTSESEELRDILAEIERERAELDSFYGKAASGLLSADGLARVEAARLPRIADAERRAREIRFMPHVLELAGDGPDLVPARWGELEITQKRDVLSALFARITIMPVGAGRRNVPGGESVKLTPRNQGR
jgi:DNA invertase Pin-like site-specific DNA recombinase